MLTLYTFWPGQADMRNWSSQAWTGERSEVKGWGQGRVGELVAPGRLAHWVYKHHHVAHTSAMAPNGLPSFCPVFLGAQTWGWWLHSGSGFRALGGQCMLSLHPKWVQCTLSKRQQYSTPRVMPSEFLGSHPIVILHTPRSRNTHRTNSLPVVANSVILRSLQMSVDWL